MHDTLCWAIQRRAVKLTFAPLEALFGFNLDLFTKKRTFDVSYFYLIDKTPLSQLSTQPLMYYNVSNIFVLICLTMIPFMCSAKQQQQQEKYQNIIFQYSLGDSEQTNTWCAVEDGRPLEEIRDLNPFQPLDCDAGGEAVYCNVEYIDEEEEEEQKNICAMIAELCQKAKGTILPIIIDKCNPND